MSVIIGCSPSTGSSLLRRMLDRHPDLFCGSETAMFAKEPLYTNWHKNKSKLFKSSIFGLTNAGWHNFTGIDLAEEYIYNKTAAKQLVSSNQASDFPNFVDSFYKPILAKANKRIWIEKTPSNAFTLNLFLENFEKGKVIHITRHPLDAITSLYKRGMTLYNAVAVYLLNTAKALELFDDPRCLTIKYESLVSCPEDTLTDVCTFIGAEYSDEMLEPKEKSKGVTHMAGWKYKETDKVGRGSIGRFRELDLALQQEMMGRLTLVSTNLQLAHKDIFDIAVTLSYDLPEAVFVPGLDGILRKEFRKDLFSRHFSNAYFRKHNYPIVIGNGLA